MTTEKQIIEVQKVILDLINALKKEARRDSDGDLTSVLTVQTIENAREYLNTLSDSTEIISNHIVHDSFRTASRF